MSLRVLLVLTACFAGLQSVAKADEIITTVFNVFESQRTERILVLSGADGRVYKATKSETNLSLYKSLLGKVVKLNFVESGKEAVIKKIELAKASEVDSRVMDLNHFQYNQLRQFAPTDLQSLEAATQVFSSMLNDGDRRRSQCFKRAHMWAYDMWANLGLSTQKIFIFYTRRYAILEEFEWWFHVAPMVVAGGVEYVLDGTFMEKPITVEAWKNYFIKSEKINCPVIDKYLPFNDGKHNDSAFHWNRLCYLMKVPMYHFSPSDLEARDIQGVPRNNWVIEELQDARRAFKNYEDTYEGLDTGKPTIKF